MMNTNNITRDQQQRTNYDEDVKEGFNNHSWAQEHVKLLITTEQHVNQVHLIWG